MLKKYLGNPIKQDLTEEICQHEGLDAFVDNLATVFGRKHNVIVTGKDTVRLAAEVLKNITWKRCLSGDPVKL